MLGETVRSPANDALVNLLLQEELVADVTRAFRHEQQLNRGRIVRYDFGKITLEIPVDLAVVASEHYLAVTIQHLTITVRWSIQGLAHSAP